MANLEEIKNKLNSINNGNNYKNGDAVQSSAINDIINSSKGIVENVEDLSSSKQDTLVSGENIKTINGKSILGSGDLTIEGGGGGSVDLENYYTKEETDTAIDTKIEKVYLEGEGAPTTATQGEASQLYADKTNGDVYQLKSIVDGVYTWIKLITEKDYATNTKKGLFGLYANRSDYGINIRDGGAYLNVAGFATLNSRTPITNPSSSLINGLNRFGAITPATIDYAVKRALIDNKLETAENGTYKWTEEEKATARANLGIGGKLYLHTLDIANNGKARYGIIKILSPKSEGGYSYNYIKDLFDNSLYIMDSYYCLFDESGDASKDIAYTVKFGFVNEKSTSNNAPSMLLYIDDKQYNEGGDPIDFEKGFRTVNFNDLFEDFGGGDVVGVYTISEWTSF